MTRTEPTQTPRRLLIMSRYPEPGRTKTRLILGIGAEAAALVHRELIKQVRDRVFPLADSQEIQIEVHYEGGDAAQWYDLLGHTPCLIPQNGHSLGERIVNAMHSAFADGASRVVVLGTDCPEIDSNIIRQAFADLEFHDVVIGPALDGGYYLIGVRVPSACIFQEIDWGTDSVLKQTLLKCRQHGLTVKQLVPLADVDHPEDLLICRQHPDLCSQILPQTTLGLVSIIIPTLNEERQLARTLSPLLGNRNVELIVVDAGSNDRTTEIAQELGARVIQTQPGRGRQMNAGAALARGEVLLFLHADSLLPAEYFSEIWSILFQGGIAGAFSLKIESELAGIRWIEWGANIRSRYRQLPYGDQGLFLRAADFYQMRGFKYWPLMEDYEFCRRLKQRGRILISSAGILTSGRRWESLGVMKTTLMNQLCINAYRGGVSPESIARFYRRPIQNH
ncbi:MAG: TIGR04283 family arsenosugar biosynthesis glycosyltransferase [Planctomycetota bacterium]